MRFADRRWRRERYEFYPGIGPLPETIAPNLRNRGFTLTAALTVPADGPVDGVIVAHGSHSGGYAAYLKGRRLHFAYNFVGTDITVVAAEGELPTGEVEAKVVLTRGEIGTFGVELFYDDAPVGRGKIERRTPVTYGMIGFAVGYQPGGADLPRPRGPRRGHPRRARQGRDRTGGPPARRPGRGAPQGPRHPVIASSGQTARMSDPYADFPALTFDRPSDGVLRITLDAPGLNAVGPGRPRAARRRVAGRRPRSRHAGGAAAGRRQGVLGRRELRADRLGDQRRGRAAAHACARRATWW